MEVPVSAISDALGIEVAALAHWGKVATERGCEFCTKWLRIPGDLALLVSTHFPPGMEGGCHQHHLLAVGTSPTPQGYVWPQGCSPFAIQLERL